VGKRGDKRRTKAKDRKRRQAIPYEGFTFGPLTIERYGRYLRSSLDTSHPSYASFREAMRLEAPEVATRFARLREEFVELTEPYDAFDVLASLWLINVPRPVDTYKEWEDTGLAVACEMAATILICRESREGSRLGMPPGPDVLSRAQALVHDMVELSTFAVAQDTVGDAPPDDFDHIRTMARMHRLAVRGVSYDWQEEQTVLDLFDADGVREDVLAAAGFSASTALALSDKVFALGLDRLRARGAQARESVSAAIDDLHNAKAGRPLSDDRHAALLAPLEDLPVADGERQLRTVGIAWIGAAAGRTLSFSVSDVATYAGTEVKETKAFLDAFSATFNEFDGVPDIEVLRDRPLVRDDSGNYLCFSQHNLHWGIRRRVESALKGAGVKTFARYERHRRRVVEERALAALTSALRPDWSESNLRYRVTEDGKDKWPEIDGLLRLDSILMVVEAKGSSMRPSARRGAPASLRSWLEKEVSHAAKQARRASTALTGGGAAELCSASGKKRLSLPLDGARDAIEVVVVLEDLPVIGPSTWRLADANLIPRDPIPWVVSLHELEIICDLVERPSELIHYLQRRRRMDTSRRAWAMDELDYFAHYLMRGLFWLDAEEGTTVPPEQLLSHTEEIDAYYMYQRGERTKKAERPSQNHHRDVKELLDSLDGLDADGRLDAALGVLDMDSKSRRRIASGIKTLKRRSSLNGRSHDQTVVFDGWGATVMTVPPSEANDLPRLLQNYCLLKKYQCRANRWIGFGGFEGPPEPAQLAAVFDDPWTQDTALDKLVAELPSAQSGDGNFDARAHERQIRLSERRKSRR
jgi:hypothetical protein